MAWSELHENQLVTASGDGSIKLYDTTLMDHPIRNWHEHSRETFCVDWNNLKKELFMSSSWDASVKVVSSGAAPIAVRRFAPRSSYPPHFFVAVAPGTTALTDNNHGTHRVRVLGDVVAPLARYNSHGVWRWPSARL